MIQQDDQDILAANDKLHKIAQRLRVDLNKLIHEKIYDVMSISNHFPSFPVYFQMDRNKWYTVGPTTNSAFAPTMRAYARGSRMIYLHDYTALNEGEKEIWIRNTIEGLIQAAFDWANREDGDIDTIQIYSSRTVGQMQTYKYK